MWTMEVLIILLLFGVQLLNGQTVSKLEFENGTEVYQIIELQNNTVEFVNPVKKQPTLREIIFYKVVEKPYIEPNNELETVTKGKEKPKKPDFDDTVRPFTNGHGLQFLTWGGQDENIEHTHAPEEPVSKNSTSISSDNNENHDGNDDKANDSKDNDNDELNDDDKNNDKKSDIDKKEDVDDDDDVDKSNERKSNVDKEDEIDDNEDDDDKSINKEHLNDDLKTDNDDDIKDDDDDRSNSGDEKGVHDKDEDDKYITEDKVKGEEVNKEDEKIQEDEVFKEEINLAKKLRSELFNSTKEKYHTLVRNHENDTLERRKREVTYQNIPEAPTLPDLDINTFPAYVQRMLIDRPTLADVQDSAKVRSNYDTDLFHKMEEINEPKTYGFKYGMDSGESWNDIFKPRDNQQYVMGPTFKDLSGSQTNDPYEKLQEPDMENIFKSRDNQQYELGPTFKDLSGSQTNDPYEKLQEPEMEDIFKPQDNQQYVMGPTFKDLSGSQTNDPYEKLQEPDKEDIFKSRDNQQYVMGPTFKDLSGSQTNDPYEKLQEPDKENIFKSRDNQQYETGPTFKDLSGSQTNDPYEKLQEPDKEDMFKPQDNQQYVMGPTFKDLSGSQTNDPYEKLQEPDKEDIFKSRDNQQYVMGPTFKDLSGSQTNDPYEKLQEPDMEVRNNFDSDEDRPFNKKKDEIHDYLDNFDSTTSDTNYNIDIKQNNEINNKELKQRNDLDTFLDKDIKDKLLTMFQNIDNKLLNGNPKTYGISIKDDKIVTWNDVSVTPTVAKNENANQENILENKANIVNEPFNNAENRLNFYLKEDNYNKKTMTKYDNAHIENIVISKPYGIEEKNDAEENINISNNNIDKDLEQYDEKPAANVDNVLNKYISANKLENESNTIKENSKSQTNNINTFNYNIGQNADNHDEEIDNLDKFSNKNIKDKNKTDENRLENKNKEDSINPEKDINTFDEESGQIQESLNKAINNILETSTEKPFNKEINFDENEKHERRKREINYQNLPEAPTLPDLDIKDFPAYVQRMLANRPVLTKSSQDNANTRSHYDTDLFHKMDGMFSNNKTRTYGFKYNKDRSESWNDIHKTEDNHQYVMEPTFKDLSGSQTNDPYEKLPEPDIEIRNNYESGEDRTLSKNKDKIDGPAKNIYITTGVINNNIDKKQKNLEINNKEPQTTDNPDKKSDKDIKGKLLTMFQNIDNKFTNGKPPKTYGMSIKGDKVQTWNDISVTPSAVIYQNTNKENKQNIVGEDFNNPQNRFNVDFKEDRNNYNEGTMTKFNNEHKDNIAINKPQGLENHLYLDQDNMNILKDNIDKYSGKHDKPISSSDNALNGNISENELEFNSDTINNENSEALQNYVKYDEETELNQHETEKPNIQTEENVGEDSRNPNEDTDNYDEEFDQVPESTNKFVNNISELPTEEPIDEETYLDESDESKDNYGESENSQHMLPTERFTEVPKSTKEKLSIDNEDLRLKMEDSFDNIIKKFPELKKMDKPESKAVVDFNNFDDSKRKPVQPNTYGMHLEGDRGYMWNDLTNPGTLTYVGNLNKINETYPTINHETTTATYIIENKTEYPTPESPNPTTNSNIEERTTESITITEQQNTVEEEHKEVTENPNKIENEKNNCSCNEDKVNENKDVNSSNKNETDTLKTTLDELLKKEEFWQWLSNWTSTYMEVLNERVETLVKNEVANQLKELNDKNNNKTNKVDEGNKINNTIDDNADKTSGNKDNTTVNENVDESHTKNNATSDSKEEKPNTTALEPERNSNVTDKTTERNNSEAIIKENELNKIINSTDKDLNKGKNDSLPVSIKSDTIYGNSIGNDHVTNIFIFYPSVDSNKTVEKIEPTLNKTNTEISASGEKPANITIDERFGTSEEDKKNDVDKIINKTKDIVNGQTNTSSTVSPNNTEDTSEKSKNSSKATTTENPATTNSEEESKNKTNDTRSTNNEDLNKATTEINDTVSDKPDSNTTEINKTEITTGIPIKSEDETTPLSTTDKATEKSGSTTENSESTTEKSDSTTGKSDISTEKSDASTEKSDVVTESSDSSPEKSDSTTEKSDSTTEKSDSTTEKSDSKDTSDVTEKSADS